jgi:hypothetical protein
VNYEYLPLQESDRKAVGAVFNHGGEFVDRVLAMCKGYPAYTVRAEAEETVPPTTPQPRCGVRRKLLIS